MSGHSHWAGIKRKKGLVDAKRGKVFSRAAKLIATAARQGGGDPGMNMRLAFAIDQAKAVNMPKDNIERAIQKGTGALAGAGQYQEIVYEGYGPGGVAIMVDAGTDNKNRTGGDVRHILEKAGGSLGASNCVAWMFERKGLFIVDTSTIDEDELTMIALDAGAEDLETVGDTYQITCAPTDFAAVRDALKEGGVALDGAELANIPTTSQAVNAAVGRRIINLLENLEDHDDVQSVTANVELPEELLNEDGDSAG